MGRKLKILFFIVAVVFAAWVVIPSVYGWFHMM